MIVTKNLFDIGFKEGKEMGLAIKLVSVLSLQSKTDTEIINLLKDLLKNPNKFKLNSIYSNLVKELTYVDHTKHNLESVSKPYKVWGKDNIEEGALNQMNIAMKLPVAIKGALMPDAHQGYGLPIGGVLATNNEVIPYGVGVDIGCRMCLSIFEWNSNLINNTEVLKSIINASSRFGTHSFKSPKDHHVLYKKEFDEIKLLKGLKDKARKQIGTSGSGNHFVEIGELDVTESIHSLQPARYIGVLTHSGSRGFGATIAKKYTEIAMKKCKLPQEAKHLAWLDLNTEEGQEYWISMNLAGDYASACHHQIHDRIESHIGLNYLKRIENHHNFAWKENGLIVHRKGATPAGKNVLGIIPGSMTSPGYIVEGTGEKSSMCSASHGAGRKMSRTKAKSLIKKSDVIKQLTDHRVSLIGGGLDESPDAYKDIETVINQQQDLVKTKARFYPRVVRMCSEKEESSYKNRR